MLVKNSAPCGGTVNCAPKLSYNWIILLFSYVDIFRGF